jgi:hypothetical protein
MTELCEQLGLHYRMTLNGTSMSVFRMIGIFGRIHAFTNRYIDELWIYRPPPIEQR